MKFMDSWFQHGDNYTRNYFIQSEVALDNKTLGHTVDLK